MKRFFPRCMPSLHTGSRYARLHPLLFPVLSRSMGSLLHGEQDMPVSFQTPGIDVALAGRFFHGTTGFAGVAAVAEPAMIPPRGEVPESPGQFLRADMPQAEVTHAG